MMKYSRVGQLQLTGELHNTLMTQMRAANVYNAYIANEGIEVIRKLLFTNRKLR
jgi:hypothetical protein